MDSLNYNYKKGTNQLTNVRDGVSATNYPNDIDDEPSKYNYRYNLIGQLAKDDSAHIDTIIWNVYGKVKKVVKTNNDSLVFVYDPLGNRLEKRFYPHSGTSDTTLYSRDAEGNILAIYDEKKDTVNLLEWDMYGSKRLGSIDTILRMQKPITGYGPIDTLTIAYFEGQKQYELDNHLGNVLAIVSDRKWAIDTTATPNIANYYQPNIISAQDYYPFGMLEPGREYSILGDSSYRYGFNGMMKDNDIYGADDFYSSFYRGYDPRLGRWLSIDPKMAVYPGWSPYCFSFDNPINFNDPNGDVPSPPNINEIVAYGMNNSPTFAKLVKDADIPLDNPNQIIEFQNSNTSPNGKDYRGATRIGAKDPENGCIEIQDQDNIKENVLTVTHELSNRIQSVKQNEILKAYQSGEIDAKEYGYEVCVSEIEGQVNQLYVCAELGINTGDKNTDNIISRIKNKTIARADVYKAFYGDSKENYIKNNKKEIDAYAKNVKCLNYKKNKVNHKSKPSSSKSRASF